MLGDSISHGFKSFAIADTDWSWPAQVARYGGIDNFKYPAYPGPDECRGLPLNLEALIRSLDVPTSLFDIPTEAGFAVRLHKLMAHVEQYWERGDGADLVDAASTMPRNHNLAIWGWDVRDVLSRSVGDLKQRVEQAGHHNNLAKQLPSAAGERSALLTLAGGDEADTPLTMAEHFGEDGDGIETLIVALGANNVLGAALDFDIAWSQDADYQDLDAKAKYNVWTPTHFKAEYDELIGRVERIRAQHVILFTVPHVTITPMVRGVGDKMPGSRYFARYTRPWITDGEFHPDRHPCLSGDQLRVLDFVVDEYNDHIARVAATRSNFSVLDIAGILDRLAYRRFMLDKEAQPDWWTPYDLPDDYLELSPQPDTRFYRSDRFGRSEGGLFALDGIHPTTIGYGILAREVMNLMTHLGVELANTQPNFAELIANDTLISDPVTALDRAFHIVDMANRAADLYQALRHKRPI